MKAFYFLSDFPERKNAGKNFVAICPKCGKKHLSISKATGLYHCFYAGCDFHGKLRDFWEERPYISDSPFTHAGAGAASVTHKSARCADGNTASQGGSGNFSSEVPMTPDDYQHLTPGVLAAIKPLTDDAETTDPDQLAARRYLADQHISLKIAIEAHIGCLTHRCFNKDKDDKKSAGTMYHCIAYVNYVNRQPVNVKYRSCDLSSVPATGDNQPTNYTKCWS